MLARSALFVFLALGLRACVAYEYEHEFWLRVDGAGTVYVTGRPGLWAAFKDLRLPADTDGMKRAARDFFARSGLRVRRVTLTRREGRPYLFVSADFDDVNRLSGTPAFPDLQVRLERKADHLRLQGSWRRPLGTPPAPGDSDGLMAVRFHLPSKVYEHHNAVEGVERGNIVGWRQQVAAGLGGQALTFGAVMDHRSILRSTVWLFLGAIVLGLFLVGGAVYLTARKGRRERPAA